MAASAASAPSASHPTPSLPTPNPTAPPARKPKAQGQAQPPPAVHRRDLLILSSSLVLSQLAQMVGAGTPLPSRSGRPATASAAAAATSGSGRGLSAYIKKKQLDPLETYVPLALEAREALAASQRLATADATAARELLRSGPFNGLRDNIRALGEYASRDEAVGRDGAAALVTGFFRALEGYDFLLSGAIREAKTLAAADVDAAVKELAAAFDALLATVPKDIVARSREVLAVTQAKAAATAEAADAAGDEELVQLLR